MSESFELKIPETVQVPKESLIRVVAKTLSDTLHPGDEYSHRVFEESELTLASRSLALKPVGLNHKEQIPGAIVVNADWNFKDKVVEAILSLPQKFIELIRKKEISKVSVDYNWDSVEKKDGKSIFKGLKFLGLSLLHGANPGDPGATILFESQSGKEVMEITPTTTITDLGEKVEQRDGKWCVIHCHGPDAGKPIKCFDDKADADAMHRAIQANKESVKKLTEQEPRSDADRAKTHFNISDEEWDKLTPEEKQAYIDKLPDRGSAGEQDDRPPEPWFSDCVASVTGKADDPEALCNWIWYNRVESAEVMTLGESAEIVKLKKEVDAKNKKIGELETAVLQITKTNEALKATHDKNVKEAEDKGRNDTKKEFAEELDKIIPKSHIENAIIGKTAFGKQLCENLKKVRRTVDVNGSNTKS